MGKATIPEEEWEALVDIFYDIDDALEEGNDNLIAEFTFDLNTQLDKLEETHGQLAIIVATRADYCDDLDEQQGLYQQALGLAKEQQDEVVLVQTLESLYYLAQEELNDQEQTDNWKKQLKQAIDNHGDEWLCEPVDW